MARSSLVAAVAVAGAMAVGCADADTGAPSGLPEPGSVIDVAAEPAVDAIIDKMVAAQTREQSMHMRTNMDFVYDYGPLMDAHMVMEAEQWVAGPDKLRMEFAGTMSMDMSFDDLDAGADGSSAAGIGGAPPGSFSAEIPIEGTAVQNGGTLTMYLPQMNGWVELDVSDAPFANPEQMALYSRDMFKSMADNFSFTYEGRGLVAGRETHIVRGVPKPDAETFDYYGMDFMTFGEVEAWVDPESWQILRMNMEAHMSWDDVVEFAGEVAADREARLEEAPFDGIDMVASTEVTELELDVELPEALFTFEPPEGAVELSGDEYGMGAASAPAFEFEGDTEWPPSFQAPEGDSGYHGDADAPSERGAVEEEWQPSEPPIDFGADEGGEGADAPFDLGALDLPAVTSFEEAATALDYELAPPSGLPEGCRELSAQLEPLLSFAHEPDAAVAVMYDCPNGLLSMRQYPGDVEPITAGDFVENASVVEHTLADGRPALLRSTGDGWHELVFQVDEVDEVIVALDAYWPPEVLTAVAESMR